MNNYFTIKELVRSKTAENKGIDNTPSEQQVKQLQGLIDNVLNPLREAYGKPIYVNSGYRCKELNREVGGVVNSHHLCENGYAAADLNTKTKRGNHTLFELAKSMDLPYCECFDEFNYAWIHISYNINKVEKELGHLG